ncbi:MAG: HepT-like ribonuclease domain-containing protein [bacterium]|nr:HepT-like ribonuclease domain-containing protein [bacterium]
MKEDDLIRLRHMLEAAHTVAMFAAGESRASLDNDLKLTFALVHAIQIIGEAAFKISKESRDEQPQIPWSKIIGMRHVLVHDYFDIDRDLVWSTVTKSIPDLIGELEKIVPPSES